MAGRGEVLERMTLIPAPGGELEGLFQAGSGEGQGAPVALAPPHPRLFGSMDSSVLSEIVWTLAREDHPTLRFNYRGVGASRGEAALPDLYGRLEPVDPDALRPLLEDLSAAVDLLCETCGVRACAVVGYSVGAWAAARLGQDSERISQVILVAPPTRILPIDFAALEKTGMPVDVLVGAADTVAPPEEVKAAVDGRFAVGVIQHANHGFVRGLSELGTRVTSVVR